jgi:phosphate transport system substrate-binding protein
MQRTFRLMMAITLWLVALGPLVARAEDKANEAVLHGCGSTMIGPAMRKWAADYEKARQVRIDYQFTGSGAGIRQFTQGVVDFACVDAPLSAQQRQAAGDVIEVPLALGGVVPIYTLKEAKKPLHFTGPVLAEIFLGKVKRWNDPKIQKLNPGVELPNQEIVVVHRTDASGTTYIWSDYLCRVCPAWKDRVGKGFSLKWPAGTGERTNEGVAAKVQQTRGAIGYVELAYAQEHRLTFGAVQNRDGKFVRASPESLAAAARTIARQKKELTTPLVDAGGDDSYPIVGASYALFAAGVKDGKGPMLRAFFQWVSDQGQLGIKNLGYAPLPKELAEQVASKLMPNQETK